MTFKSIKRPKKSIKISKKQNQSTYFDFFDHYWSLSIDFDLVAIFWTDNNQFCHNELKSGFKIGSKKSIKSQFDCDINWNLALDRLDRQSLVRLFSCTGAAIF